MSQGPRDYEEKRKFIRMSIDSTVKMYVNETAYDGICLDLSSTGMQIRALKTSLAVGDKLKVHLPSSLPQLPPLDVAAEVVRVDNLGAGEQLLGLVTTVV